MSWYGEMTMRTIGRGLLGMILLVAVPALPASGGICQFSPCLEEGEAPPATQAVATSSAPSGSGESVSGAGVSCQITPCMEEVEAAAVVESKAAATSDDGLSLSATAPRSCGEGCWSSGIYGYDDAGNITAIGGDEYRYDLVGRITRGTVVMPDGTTRTQSYAYDSFGNILDRTTDGFQVETSVDPTTNRPQFGLYGAYTWDAAGAMTFSGDSGESYAWDGVGMMTRRSGTRNLTFLYTADDERIAVFENDPSGNPLRATWTLRGLDHKVLRTWTSTGGPYATDDWQWKQDYVYRDGGRLLATVTPEGVHHFHLDHLGTPRVITDAQGVKLAEHTYFPFGLEATDEHQNAEVMKFTGHERDLDPHSIHDLDYMHARYYSPNLGRFLSVDPGKDWDLKRPQSWKLYSYTRNNPVNFSDPTGRYLGASNEELAAAHEAMTPEQREQFAKAQETGFKVAGALALAFTPGPEDLILGGWLAKAGGRMLGRLFGKSDEVSKTIKVSSERFGEAAEHMKDAQSAGQPRVLTIDRSGASSRRAEALKDHPKVKGKDRDEYPPAMFKEGGQGSSVRPIDRTSNRGCGSYVGNQCRDLPDGAKVQIQPE